MGVSTRKYFLISLSTVFVLTLILLITRGIVYETVDDFNVMYSIAGYKTGAPFWQLTFYNCIYAGFISIFYRITGYIQWYTVFQIICIFSSLVVIMFAYLRIAKCTKKNIWIAIAIFSGLYVSAYMYILQRMQFTTTAAIMGAAGVSMMYLFLEEGKKRDLLISCAFILGAYLNRRLAGLFVIALWGGLFVVHEIIEWKKRDKKELVKRCAILAGCMLIVLGIRIADQYVKRTKLNKDYMVYDEYRGKFQDYQKPSYVDNRELYNSVGWDDKVYSLVNALIYIDPRINEESFRTLVESDAFQSHLPFKDAVKMFTELCQTEPAAEISVILLITFAAFAIMFAHITKNKKTLLLAIYSVCAWLAFVVYLSYSGRLPLRVGLLVTLPPMTLLLMIATAEVIRRNKKIDLLRVCLLPLLIALSFSSVNNIYVRLSSKDSYSQKIMFDFENYALSHPDKVFLHDYTICNVYNAYSATHVYVKKKPTNIILSGGSYTYSACYYAQLAANHLSKFDGETLLQDGVFFVCDNNRRGMPTFITQYLQSLYGKGVKCDLVELISDGDVAIYKFHT